MLLDFPLSALSQAEVTADASCSSWPLHVKLWGWGRFLWPQHHLHPEREPPADHQLLKEDDRMNRETHKKIFSLVRVCQRKVLRASRTSLVRRTSVAMHYKFASQLFLVIFLAQQSNRRRWIIRLHFWSVQLWLWLLQYYHVSRVLRSSVSVVMLRQRNTITLTNTRFYFTYFNLKTLYCEFFVLTVHYSGSTLLWRGLWSQFIQ